MNNIWFTSDFHFGHKNIIRYCNRPFENVDDMNSGLIDIWNKTVCSNDVVYHIGDFAFGKKQFIEEILKKLNGKIIFLLGNHDKEIKYNLNVEKYEQLEIVENLQRIIMNHYCMEIWNEQERGSWHLYGHSHGKFIDESNKKRIDVGIDTNNYNLYSFEQIQDIMKNKIIL